MYWSILPHEPYFLGEDCMPKRQMLDLPPEEVEGQGYTSLFALQHAIAARCSLLLISDYFEWMKRESVYDNTKIVIVSDHGIVGSVGDHSSRAIAGGTTDSTYVASRSVLFVKERNAHGALATSEVFTPNAEVPRIVCEEIGGCSNPYLGNRPITTDGRDQPFHITIVPWQFNANERNGFRILREFSVSGADPYDVRQWETVR